MGVDGFIDVAIAKTNSIYYKDKFLFLPAMVGGKLMWCTTVLEKQKRIEYWTKPFQMEAEVKDEFMEYCDLGDVFLTEI